MRTVQGYRGQEKRRRDQYEQKGEDARVGGGGGQEVSPSLEGRFGWRCSWRRGVGGGGVIDGGHRWSRASRCEGESGKCAR